MTPYKYCNHPSNGLEGLLCELSFKPHEIDRVGRGLNLLRCPALSPLSPLRRPVPLDPRGVGSDADPLFPYTELHAI